MKKIIVLLSMTVLVMAVSACAKKEILFSEGTGCVSYVCEKHFAGKNVDVYYHIPAGDVRTMPVQIVIPGMGRNGDGYRDAWIEKADEYGFVVICPCCEEEAFPESVYQRGNVVDDEGNFNDREDMIYPLVGDIFDFFLAHSDSRAKTYNIYGHSAGGQFVHRFGAFGDPSRAVKMIAANPGWYTFPADTTAYPYGWGDAEKHFGIDKADYYGLDLTILLGTADTLRTSNLRQCPEADAQGMNRLERGEYFFDFCKRDAEALGLTFNWKKEYVPGVGHSNTKMSPPAADLIYGE